VARSVRLEEPPKAPDWASEPGIAPGTWAEIDLEVGGRHVQLASLPGVFAYDRLDEGTALLLQHLPDVQGARVLDAGCGYGPIGLAASLGGAARVLMVDVNTLAVAAAQENIARLQASACTAVAGDALAPAEGQQSDLMLSNPPFHTGKQVTYDVAETFIRHGQRLLQPGGRMVLVANRFIRYDRLLGELFAHVETLADDRRYHVLGAW
jgi:16S rRNA (guanine1207-N2)-methyltransferase